MNDFEEAVIAEMKRQSAALEMAVRGPMMVNERSRLVRVPLVDGILTDAAYQLARKGR